MLLEKLKHPRVLFDPHFTIDVCIKVPLLKYLRVLVWSLRRGEISGRNTILSSQLSSESLTLIG